MWVKMMAVPAAVSENTPLTSELQASDRNTENSTVITALHQELHEVKGQAEATKEELNNCKELSLRLQERIQVHSSSVCPLTDVLSVIKKEVWDDGVMLFLKGAGDDDLTVEGSAA